MNRISRSETFEKIQLEYQRKGRGKRMTHLVRCISGLALLAALVGCQPVQGAPTQAVEIPLPPTSTLTLTSTASNTPTTTPSPSITPTSTHTLTPTLSPTSTHTLTPTLSPTPSITPISFPSPPTTWGRGAAPDGAQARLGIGEIFSIDLSPNEELLAVGTTTGVYVYQVSTFEQVWSAATEGVAYSVKWLRDGSFLLANSDVWEWQNRAETFLSCGLSTIPDDEEEIEPNTHYYVWEWQDGMGTFLPDGLSAIPDDEQETAPTIHYYVDVSSEGFGSGATVTLMDMASGEVVHVLDPEPGLHILAYLAHFRFSPDCRRLAAYTGIPFSDAPPRDHRIYVWDVETGEQRYVLDGHEEFLAVNSVSWSPDGSRIVSGAGLYGRDDGEVILWNMETGEMLQVLLDGSPSVEAVSWSPGGEWIAAGSGDYRSGGWVTVWEVSTGDLWFTWNGYRGTVQDLIWLSEGRRLLAASRDSVVLWDVETGLPINVLRGNGVILWENMWILFSPDGSVISVNYEGQETVLWDGQTGEALPQTAAEHLDWENYSVWAIWHQENDEFVYRHTDDSTSEETEVIFALRDEHEAEILSLRFNPDRSMLASAGGILSGHGYPRHEGWEENAVIVWDAITGEPIYRFLGHTGRVVSLSWSVDGRLLASGSVDGTVILWEVTPPQ